MIDAATDAEKYAAYVERVKANPSTKTYEPLQVGKLYADVALRKYIRAVFAEAQRIGFPKMCVFAREMAKGAISLPPPVEDDPLHDAVGAFYGKLMEIERRILSEWYTPASGTLKQKAKRISKSVKNLKKVVDELIDRCQRDLMAKNLCPKSVDTGPR